MRGLEVGVARLWTGLLVVSLAFPVTAGAADKVPVRTTLARGLERQALQGALSGAIRRLERPRCQRIFSDFKDGEGRTLQERLDAVGQSGAAYLQGWILFADGRGEARCKDPRVLAITETGSRSVWICGSQFSREHRRAPGEAEVVLIHEALHVLGLGEDPPSSAAISSQVVARCGS